MYRCFSGIIFWAQNNCYHYNLSIVTYNYYNAHFVLVYVSWLSFRICKFLRLKHPIIIMLLLIVI